MNKAQEVLHILGEGSVKIHWVKALSDYANDDEIEMQDAQIEQQKRAHPGSEGGVLFPDEHDILDRNYAAVWSPANANMDDVAAAIMKA